ncbi:peptide deformylase [Tissierella creatinini]|nr:peptide deformylase [Tissierella creatinini]TJX69204.1 peptide deformylase [Soehngenia saccharolytica]
MALREIRLDGDPLLRKKSKDIVEINDRIRTLLDDMVETMIASNGVGLAAPQVGVLRRAIVLDIGDTPIKAINPEIIEEDGKVLDMEGCLSVPGYSGTVERPERIKVKFVDENGDNKFVEATGLSARIFCHEIDHLNGVLYKDKALEVFENKDLEEEEVNEE